MDHKSQHLKNTCKVFVCLFVYHGGTEQMNASTALPTLKVTAHINVFKIFFFLTFKNHLRVIYFL